MPSQAVFSIFVLGMALVDLLHAVAHQEFIVSGGEDGSRDVDEDGNPSVMVVRERFVAEEDCRLRRRRILAIRL